MSNGGDSKFTVPEPPVNMGSGFLTEYWQQQEPLPRIYGMQKVFYFLQRGVQTIQALPMSNSITIMTIAVSLFIFSGFLLLLQNVGRLMVSAGSSFYVTAYIRDGVGETEINDVIKSLEADSHVRSVKFISKQQALTAFRQDLGDKKSLLEGVDVDNPLPASIDVILQPDELGINSIDQILESLRTNTRVIDEVVYGNEWVDKIQGVLRIFRVIGIGTLSIVMVVVISLIANTIKLVFYSRRDEISIMQLVGADEWFVKLPFVIGGLLQGLIGSLLGIILLRGAFALLTMQMQKAAVFGVIVPEFMFLSYTVIIAIVILGLVIGALGSFFPWDGS